MSRLGDHPLAARFKNLGPSQVLDAVEAIGVQCTGRFSILNSLENRVYQLEVEEADQIVAKFYRPGRWSLEALEDEHDFLFELADAGIPVGTPIVLDDGYSIGTLDGEAAGIHYALFKRIRGRSLDEPTPENLENLGRLIARIHEVGREGSADNRNTLNVQSYGWDNLNVLMEDDLIHPSARDAYADAVERTLQRITPRFDGADMQRIHGDCHLGNLIWDRLPHFVDFDDFLTGPVVQDLWMLAPSRDQIGVDRRNCLARGYASVAHFDSRWLTLVEPLRALRMINYATWIARRADDPYFQRTFPDFGSASWWYREVEDLEEQIAILGG